MDIFAGSEPRQFISFHLDNEQIGQPTPQAVESMEISQENSDDTEYLSTTSQLAKEDNETKANAAVLKTLELVPADPLSPEVRKGQPSVESESVEKTTDVEMTTLDTEATVSGPCVNSAPAQNESPGAPGYALSSSGSDESCGRYISRKLAALETCLNEYEMQTTSVEKSSESGKLTLFPQAGRSSPEPTQSFDNPKVISPKPPTRYLQSSLKDDNKNPDRKKNRVTINSVIEEAEISSVEPSTTSTVPEASGQSDLKSPSRPVAAANFAATTSDAVTPVDSDADSNAYARSTLAYALTAPQPRLVRLPSDETSGTDSEPERPAASKSATLSATSREVIRKYFSETQPISLPRGHPTVAFNRDQIEHILKVVADETARSSFEMLNSVVMRASRLSLGERAATRRDDRCKSPFPHSPLSDSEGEGTSCGFTSAGDSYTSGPDLNESDFWGTEYSHEVASSQGSSMQAITPPPLGCGQGDFGSPIPNQSCASPSAQTLAELKHEAQRDRSKKHPKKSSKAKTRSSHRGVGRSRKIMREEYFKGMSWTRTFVSGPMDPKWNRYKFYCQICKGNVSIYGRGPKEILRHHATERHLRKDQRWRYEHLGVVDPVTQVVHHHVRGRYGKLLSPLELESELPKFIDVELVDIGVKLPFYDEFMAGHAHMASSSENRVRVQISILGHALPTFGNLGTLRELWKDIGVVVNHQSLFTDFNWGKERLSVSSNFACICPRVNFRF